MPNYPAYKDQIGSVSLTIWRQESGGRVWYSNTITRNYQDSNGEWQTSDSYNRGDLQNLIRAAQIAEERIAELVKNQQRVEHEKRKAAAQES